MDTFKSTINDLLSQQKCYTVPPYQRGFSWENEQVEELWTDLQGTQGEWQHFLGSIVLQFPQKREPQIIDGQQRLTTLTILLCCLRDHYNLLGLRDEAAGLHATYVETRRAGRPGGFKLRLGEFDNAFFQEFIQSNLGEAPRQEPPAHRLKSPSHRLLWSARMQLYKRVDDELTKKATDEEKRRVLEKLEEQVADNVLVIQIHADDENEAFQIFETLNDRGLSLSQADLLKNHLCMKWASETRGADIEEVVRRWDSAILRLSEKTDTGTFLRHYLLSMIPEETIRKVAEVLTVRHSTICNRSATDLERLYHKCALELRKKSENVGNVIEDLARACPEDEVVIVSFKELRRSRTTPILLRRIEESSAIEERVLEPTKVNIEHILPQSLPKEWLDYLGASKNDAEGYVERLGNLTLLGAEYNRDARNWSFDRKKTDYYPKSRIQMTRDLLSIERWDFRAIEGRQQRLAELACRTWNPRAV